MNAQAANMKVIYDGREHHNRTCPLGPAIEVHMSPFDIARLGWEEGDVIATLVLVGNPQVPPDRIRILCAGDKEAAMAQGEMPVSLPQPEFVIVPDYIPELLPVAKGCLR